MSVPAGDIVEADISDTYGLVPGQLEVTKTITGPLAGQQGNGRHPHGLQRHPPDPRLRDPAGAPAGDQSHIYSDVPTPASCVVTETMNGATSAVSVSRHRQPAHRHDPVRREWGRAHHRHLRPGSRLAAGHQDDRRAARRPSGAGHDPRGCNGTALSPAFVIASGAPAGSVSHSFDGIPAGSVCTVTETADGATATVTATVAGNGQKVTVPAGKVVPVNVMDVYLGAPGSLKVTKTIAGRAPATRSHRHPGGLWRPAPRLHLPHPGPRTGTKSTYFNRLPAGSRCTATETTNGHTSTASVVVKGGRKTAIIRANDTVIIHLVDTFTPRRHPGPIGLG